MRRILLYIPVLAIAPAALCRPPNMQAIAQALGVTCDYCHAAERGAPEPKKEIARAMIAMTRDINARVQGATGLAAAQSVQVTCLTCHRGVPVPKPLTEILTQT